MGPRFLNVNLTIKDWIEESIDLGLLHRFCHQLSCPTHQWAQIWPGLPFAADIPVKLSCCSSHLSPDSVEMGFGFSKPISVCFDSDSIFLLSKTYKKKKKKREHCYDRSFWCSYTLSTLQSCYSSLKKNPVKLTETSALLIADYASRVGLGHPILFYQE